MTQSTGANEPGLRAEALGAGSASGPRAFKRNGFLERVDGAELTIASSLVALCVLVRTLWLTPLEIWGDAGQKWLFARQLAYANDFRHAEWTHHMARFGINIPVFILQRILGTAPKVYFVVPVGAYALQVLLTYLVARRLSGRLAGILGALIVTYFSGTVRDSSQLLPDGIAGTVFVLLTYLWLFFHDANGKARLRWLAALSVAFVWAYAIKESNIFLFPAVLACVWLSRRSLKEAAIFTGIVAAYGALETAGFAIFTSYWSRLGIVQDAAEYQPIKFVDLFTRFLKLEPPWQMLLWLWVPSALWLCARRDRRFWPVLLIPASFLFLLTFLVRHVDPIVPWMGNKSRYLAVIAPMLSLGVALLVGETCQELWARFRRPRLERLAARLYRHAGVWTVSLCAVLGALTYWRMGQSRFQALRDLSNQGIVLNDAYRRNLPIIDYTPTPRALKTVYEVVLRDKYLAQADIAHDGWLPDVNVAVHRAKVHGREIAYVLPNTEAYAPNELSELIANECAVVVSLGPHSVIDVRPHQKLPRSCKGPGGQILMR